jgi:hypothetical protein
VVVVFGQGRQEFADNLDVHRSALRLGDDETHCGCGATGRIREVEAFFGEVAGEVALVAAENPDVGVHGRTLLQLKE